jgi:hypothetical protein
MCHMTQEQMGVSWCVIILCGLLNNTTALYDGMKDEMEKI